MGNVSADEDLKQNYKLDTLLGAELLRASREDKSLSVDEKLIAHRCEAVEKHIGFDDTALGQSIKYSCTAPVIGFPFYAGSDLGHHSPEKIAAHIEKICAKHGVKAKFYIQKNHPHGSSIAAIVRGGRMVMNPTDPFTAINSIEGFIAEMKLVYFKDKLISPSELRKWVQATDAYIPQTI